ncbi:MAG: hypothetical protein M0Z77_07060 [Thermoplasmatales archaeon]|jgi:membrane protein implicated in regulation of membrane protease activity|nr:hypothetical protein [Candidatus Thermoplasmatota archaeon]MCL6003310.1 hypothetical protein [Candidatus Thermoplasmatota archaeon]MDA8055392.1 hypothetical protein [Thermoplasmatales archaeon]
MSREVSSIIVKYGYRTLIILSILLAFSTFLLVAYIASKESNAFFLSLSIVFYLLTLILFVGFRLTKVERIHKKYFHTETLVGKGGRITKGVTAGNLGSVTVMNEEWSFVCDTNTSFNDEVVVTQVMDDRVTLRVRKSS